MKSFDEIYETLPGMGWLSRDEAELLWKTVNETQGPILEVGCYHGRSSVLLASTGRTLYCVDPFEGFSTEDPTGEETRKAWHRNIDDRGLERHVWLSRQRIEDWQVKPVGFAYLDGDHTSQGTENQIQVAIRCGAAVIAIHDVNDSGDGLHIRDTALRILGPWVARVERIAVWRLK